MTEYICNECNKNYASYQTLWNHNKKFHSINNAVIVQKEINKYKCDFCNKILSRHDSLKRHYSVCKKKNINDNKIEILENKVRNLENKKANIIYNNYGNINNNITINKIGSEKIDELTDDEIKTIFQREIGCIVSLIDSINFNKRLPNNHNHCNTSLESRYLNVYNPNTKKINKDRKRYFFEELITRSIDNIAELYKNKKDIFSKNRQIEIKTNIKYLKSIKDYTFNNRIVKNCINELNLLTYNKRDMIQKTWYDIKNDNSESDSESESDNDLVL